MSESPAKAKTVRPPVERPWLSEAMVILVVLAATFATYAGTLWYNFVYDDDGQIIGNSYIQYWRHVPGYFISQVWAQLFPHAGGNYYRPLFLLWLRLNDAWFGLRPMGWHATSVALHVLVTFLVYAVVRKLTGRISIAGFTALIFGLHPIHAEVVAWVSGATESLCAVFILAGFWAYLESRERNTAIWMTLSVALYACAVFSKETGIVLPVLVFGHLWIYAEGSIAEAGHIARRFFASARVALVYAPVALIYLACRLLVLHKMGHPLVTLSARQIILSNPSILGFYVKKWFLPVSLNEFYDMPYWSVLNFHHVILPALLVFALLAAIWMARNELGAREVKFALLWVIVPLVPVLNPSMLPRDELVHDRYFYLPSIGAALLVALVIDRFTRAPRSAKVFGFSTSQAVVALALAATLGLLTVHESQFWANDYTLFNRAYYLSPLNPTAVHDYGAELMDLGDYAGARAVFMKIVTDDPTDATGYLSLGRLAYQQHDYAQAEHWLSIARELDRNSPDVYANLGQMDLRTNRAAAAEGNFRTAVQLRPSDPTLLFAYGVVLELNGNCALASDQFRHVLELRPGQDYAVQQLSRCQRKLAGPSQN